MTARPRFRESLIRVKMVINVGSGNELSKSTLGRIENGQVVCRCPASRTSRAGACRR
jgi:hypothetical protein